MKLTHAEDFSEAAEDYRNARTPYYLDTVKKIFTRAAISPSDTIAELGPGEGGLTRVLLQHPGIKLPLYCIERDAGMRKKFQEHMAKEIAEGKVILIEGSAEQTNLPDGVKPKLFIGGDMAHWLSPECTQELKAKLKPGGKLAFITRYPDAQSPIV
ncbi:MAG: methyltransferase domain-containing protein, partial [Proteobacteria bacterium]|nr:methyltransferase domain-containing protein [Pseudomonadota bacterium]